MPIGRYFAAGQIQSVTPVPCRRAARGSLDCCQTLTTTACHTKVKAGPGAVPAARQLSRHIRGIRGCALLPEIPTDCTVRLPSDQIAPANRAFSPSEAEIAEARTIVAAFAAPENAGKGVVTIGGHMTERLHLAQAERLLARS